MRADDGKFLAIAGEGSFTLPHKPINVWFLIPFGTDPLEIGIFDGETSGLWDGRTNNLTYTLYADPNQDAGIPDFPIHTLPLIGTYEGTAMTDNDWYPIILDPNAQPVKDSLVPNPDPNVGGQVYCLYMKIEPNYRGRRCLSQFLQNQSERHPHPDIPLPRSFALVAPFTSWDDHNVLYPDGWPGESTYDGIWNLTVRLPEPTEGSPLPVTTLAFFDGDFDYGNWVGTTEDTADYDTTNPLANESAKGRGQPPDDNFPPDPNAEPPTPGHPALILPDVNYEVIVPDLSRTVLENTYQNDNPSGTSEWEGFRLTTMDVITDPNDTNKEADHDEIPSLPYGDYLWNIKGLDIGNLIAVAASGPLEFRGQGGQGCTPGFWKQSQHLAAWVGYSPDDNYSDVMDIVALGGPDISLIDALSAGGGGANAMGRHAVAALLNGATPYVNYVYDDVLVKEMVQEAYATGDFNRVHFLLVQENELEGTLCDNFGSFFPPDTPDDPPADDGPGNRGKPKNNK